MVPRFLLQVDLQRLPRQKTDFLVIGSGVAGLFAAREATAYGRVVLVTKERLADCNTTLAQGGIASAVAPGDSPDLHFQDTLEAGAGLNDGEALRVLVEEGPARVRELMELGVPFDRGEGGLALTREGAHSYRRILHAGGDATGQVVWQVLVARALEQRGLSIYQEAMVIDLLLAPEPAAGGGAGGAPGYCAGALVLNQRSGELVVVEASVATILASGGAAQLYLQNTNPPVTTGDGLAMAFRAGAILADMEFVQFHPTVFWHPEARGFLISEAVRGEGGILRNSRGETFMGRYHDQADLAPRDVVARAMLQEMRSSGDSSLYLDVTHLGEEFLQQRFPNIYQTCRKVGLDPARDWLPVAPAAHFLMGGVITDTWGWTGIERLYACGEAAASGVHGANRLASNSLLEGLVFSHRAVRRATARANGEAWARPTWAVPAAWRGLAALAPAVNQPAGRTAGPEQAGGDRPPGRREDLPAGLEDLKRVMEEEVGIVRQREGLARALEFVQAGLARAAAAGPAQPDRESSEWPNQLTVAGLIIRAALAREESRGAHYREDFPRPRPEWGQRHVYLRRGSQGEVQLKLANGWLPSFNHSLGTAGE